MATIFEIPLTPNAQKFFITLAGVQYQLRLIWRTAVEGGWFLDILTPSDAPILEGVPLITGADLLEPYPEKNFGGKLYVGTDGDIDATPTYGNLGTASHLFFVVP